MPDIRNIANINLLNGVLHFGFTILLKNGKRKKENDTFLRKKKTEEKQNRVTIMISVHGKGDSFYSEVEITRGIV